MERLIEIYGQWETTQQMYFAFAAVLVALVLSVLAGMWFLSISRQFIDGVCVLLRGWPVDVPSASVKEGLPKETNP